MQVTSDAGFFNNQISKPTTHHDQTKTFLRQLRHKPQILAVYPWPKHEPVPIDPRERNGRNGMVGVSGKKNTMKNQPTTAIHDSHHDK